MKKSVKKVAKKPKTKRLVSKTSKKENDFVTNKRFNEAMDRIDKRFETIDKRFETFDKRFETIDKRFVSIDKRFEDQTTTMLNAMENMGKEIINRMEVMFEVERNNNKIFFTDGLNDKEYKIKNLEKRVAKLEGKVL